jgi:NAD(P)-dependent dehydrogenase (short-subunit alcohol dehydrogenase family)
MRGKISIVTGSNTGIGKETARGLAERGATVVLACRDVAKAEAAKDDIVRTTRSSDVHVMALDLGDASSIDAFVSAFRARFDRLDLLVDNAGVTTRKRSVTKDGHETTFGVNHLGTARLTLGLLDLLKKSAPSRIVVVSSGLHYRGKIDFDDLEQARKKFDGLRAYNDSKLANVLFTKALARRIAGSGVTVNALHPGVVATELAREYPKVVMAIASLFMLTPSGGAACSLHVATAKELADVSGEYFEKSRVKRASKDARDEAAQERLWKMTEELLAKSGDARIIASASNSDARSVAPQL